MRGVAFILLMLGAFLALLYHYSFWVAFGGVYMLGMVGVALVAFVGRQRCPSDISWSDRLETEQAK